MWNDWDGTDEIQVPARHERGGQLVLSWKRLNVSVATSSHRLFELSETTQHKQILHNGECLQFYNK